MHVCNCIHAPVDAYLYTQYIITNDFGGSVCLRVRVGVCR